MSTSSRWTPEPSPTGCGRVPGTLVTLRSDAFQEVPSNWSRVTIRRYMSAVSVVVVRYRSTSRSSVWLRLFCSDTSGLTAEIVPPPPSPEPAPAAPSSPPSIAGSRAGANSARPSAMHPDPAPVAQRGHRLAGQVGTRPRRRPLAVRGARRAAEDPAPAREPVPALGQQQQQVAERGAQEPQPAHPAGAQAGGHRVQRQQRQPGGRGAAIRHRDHVHHQRDQHHPAHQQQLDPRRHRCRGGVLPDVLHTRRQQPAQPSDRVGTRQEPQHGLLARADERQQQQRDDRLRQHRQRPGQRHPAGRRAHPRLHQDHQHGLGEPAHRRGQRQQ